MPIGQNNRVEHVGYRIALWQVLQGRIIRLYVHPCLPPTHPRESSRAACGYTLVHIAGWGASKQDRQPCGSCDPARPIHSTHPQGAPVSCCVVPHNIGHR